MQSLITLILLNWKCKNLRGLLKGQRITEWWLSVSDGTSHFLSLSGPCKAVGLVSPHISISQLLQHFPLLCQFIRFIDDDWTIENRFFSASKKHFSTNNHSNPNFELPVVSSCVSASSTITLSMSIAISRAFGLPATAIHDTILHNLVAVSWALSCVFTLFNCGFPDEMKKIEQ